MFLQQYKCSQCSSNGVAQGQPYKNRENVKVVPKVLYFYGTHTEYRSVWNINSNVLKSDLEFLHYDTLILHGNM